MAIVATLKLAQVWTLKISLFRVLSNHSIFLKKGQNLTAWQRFLSTGPVALLPVIIFCNWFYNYLYKFFFLKLTDEYSSLVWSIKKSLAGDLLKMSDEEFVHQVNSAFVKEDFKNELGTKIENIVQDGFDFIRSCKWNRRKTVLTYI